MRQMRIAGLCLGVVLVFSATVAVSAFAAAPEVGRCVKVAAKTGKFTSATCTKEKAGGSYEWLPGAVKTAFKGTGATGTLETIGKVTVQCKMEKSEGNFTGVKTVGNVIVEFTECASGGFKCESPGAMPGVIKTNALTGLLVWENKAKKKVALKLSAQTGEVLAQFKCGPASVEVRGAVLVNVPTLKMEEKFALKYSAKKGVQKPDVYETESGEKVKAYLETNGAGLTKGWEQSGQTVTNTQTNEELLEVNSDY